MSNKEIQDRLFRQLFDLSGQVAVVTGGLGRLGSEYVRTLAEAGDARLHHAQAGGRDAEHDHVGCR